MADVVTSPTMTVFEVCCLLPTAVLFLGSMAALFGTMVWQYLFGKEAKQNE